MPGHVPNKLPVGQERVRLLYEEYVHYSWLKQVWNNPVTEKPDLEPSFAAGCHGIELCFLLLSEFLVDNRVYVAKRPRIEAMAWDIRAQCQLLGDLVDGDLEEEGQPLSTTLTQDFPFEGCPPTTHTVTYSPGLARVITAAQSAIPTMTNAERNSLIKVVLHITSAFESAFQRWTVGLGIEHQLNSLLSQLGVKHQVPVKPHNLDYAALVRPQVVEATLTQEVYTNPEDFFFRTIHLGTECWMSVANTRVSLAARSAREGNWHLASARIAQAARILHYLGDHMMTLTRMNLRDYLQLKVQLEGTSGAGSSQVRAIRGLVKGLMDPLADHVKQLVTRDGAAAAGVPLLTCAGSQDDEALLQGMMQVYLDCDRHAGLYNYAKALEDIESALLGGFYYKHYCLAANVIGSESRGTMRRAVAALKSSYEKHMFPVLDAVRSQLGARFDAELSHLKGKMMDSIMEKYSASDYSEDAMVPVAVASAATAVAINLWGRAQPAEGREAGDTAAGQAFTTALTSSIAAVVLDRAMSSELHHAPGEGKDGEGKGSPRFGSPHVGQSNARSLCPFMSNLDDDDGDAPLMSTKAGGGTGGVEAGALGGAADGAVERLLEGQGAPHLPPRISKCGGSTGAHEQAARVPAAGCPFMANSGVLAKGVRVAPVVVEGHDGTATVSAPGLEAAPRKLLPGVGGGLVVVTGAAADDDEEEDGAPGMKPVCGRISPPGSLLPSSADAQDVEASRRWLYDTSGLSPHFLAWRTEATQQQQALSVAFLDHAWGQWAPRVMEAGLRALLQAGRAGNATWDELFGRIQPQASAHVLELLGMEQGVAGPSPAQVHWGHNSHELVWRLISCYLDRKVLTGCGVQAAGQDGQGTLTALISEEFYSLTRQLNRLTQQQAKAAGPSMAGQAEMPALDVRVELVQAEPVHSFCDRLVAKAAELQPQVVYCSQITFLTQRTLITDVPKLVTRLAGELSKVASASEPPLVLVDGYHAFCAVPTDLGQVLRCPAVTRGTIRFGYVAGLLKHAGCGANAAFLVLPGPWRPRPLFTGWLADTSVLGPGSPGICFGSSVEYTRDLALAGSTPAFLAPLACFNHLMECWKQPGSPQTSGTAVETEEEQEVDHAQSPVYGPSTPVLHRSFRQGEAGFGAEAQAADVGAGRMTHLLPSISVNAVHQHVLHLQRHFVEGLQGLEADVWYSPSTSAPRQPRSLLLSSAQLVNWEGSGSESLAQINTAFAAVGSKQGSGAEQQQSHTLVFQCGTPQQASEVVVHLSAQHIAVDSRKQYVRVGFGFNHTVNDVDKLLAACITAGQCHV